MEQRHLTLLRAFSGHLASTLAAVCVLQTQPRWSYLLPDVQRPATVPFQWLLRVHGTICRHPSGMEWNAPSLMSFRRDLKTVLFRSSFDLHNWAFTRSDPGYVRLSVRPVGQTVGQTVAEPPT